MLWERVDDLAARAPGPSDLRFHGLQLVAARHAPKPLPLDLRVEQQLAAIRRLCAPDLLERARAAIDGDVLLVKGPEAAARWRSPGLRPFVDLDLLVTDSAAAQAALLGAGFHEVGDPRIYRGIHHLRPLQWGDEPLTIELHHRPKWPARLPAPPLEEIRRGAVPSATGVPGIGAPDPAAHALLLAGHSWAHAPLASLRHLIDVAAVSAETERATAGARAARWGCARLWATTIGAVDAVLLGGPPTAATRTWARYLAAAREHTVLQRHLQEAVAPLWALPPRAGVGVLAARADALLRAPDDETWATKLHRTGRALRDARVPRSRHDPAVHHPPVPLGEDEA
jgi:hypothetical protein